MVCDLPSVLCLMGADETEEVVGLKEGAYSSVGVEEGASTYRIL